MIKKKKQFYCRCGICNENFSSSEEWDRHTQTRRHKAKVLAFEKMMAMTRYKGEHVDVRGFVKKIQEQSKMEETISDIYMIVEAYELGSLTQREYLKACKDALEYFKKKYGKDDFRFRELFAHMQGDDWENTFVIRCLVHAETIGCPHATIEQCDKYKNEVELKFLKGRKCQHCSYLEGVKERWEEK